MANTNQAPLSASKPLATGTQTVTVACKLPQGHRARLFAKHEIQSTTPAGVIQTVTQFQPTGEEFVFRGPQHAQNEGPRVVTAGGFALTFGVPADFWDSWYAQHKDHDLVKSGLIFSQGRKADTIDAAKERKDLRTGLERVDPSKPLNIGGQKVSFASEESPVKIGRLDSDED